MSIWNFWMIFHFMKDFCIRKDIYSFEFSTTCPELSTANLYLSSGVIWVLHLSLCTRNFSRPALFNSPNFPWFICSCLGICTRCTDEWYHLGSNYHISKANTEEREEERLDVWARHTGMAKCFVLHLELTVMYIEHKKTMNNSSIPRETVSFCSLQVLDWFISYKILHFHFNHSLCVFFLHEVC